MSLTGGLASIFFGGNRPSVRVHAGQGGGASSARPRRESLHDDDVIDI